MALDTQIEIFTIDASDKVLFGQFGDAAVASASRNRFLLFDCGSDEGDLRVGELRLDISVARKLFRGELFGCAVNVLTFIDDAFDQPMITIAGDSSIVTLWTQVEITIVTGAAMVVDVWDRDAATITVNRE